MKIKKWTKTRFARGLLFLLFLSSGALFFSFTGGSLAAAAPANPSPLAAGQRRLVVSKQPTKLTFDFAVEKSAANEYRIGLVSAPGQPETEYVIEQRHKVDRVWVRTETHDYRYYRVIAADGSVDFRVKATIKNLDPTTRYQFTLSKQVPKASQPYLISRGAAVTPPRPPRNIAIDSGTIHNRRFLITWDLKDEATQEITGYNVYFREDRPDNVPAYQLANLRGWSRVFTTAPRFQIVSGFAIGKRYEFLVRTVGFDGSESPIRKKSSATDELPGLKILIVDGGEHERNVRGVLEGDYHPMILSHPDATPANRKITSSSEAIDLGAVSSTGTMTRNNRWIVHPGGSDESFDILNLSLATNNFSSAEKFFREIEAAYGHHESKPILVLSSGNAKTICSREAYEFAKLNGRFPSDRKYKYKSREEQQAVFYLACNLIPAYIAEEHPDFMENVIVVGGNYDDPEIFIRGRQLPGAVLQDHWISTYYAFTPRAGGKRIYGTSYSVPYLIRTLAKIRRRLPFLSNADTIQMIYDTARPRPDSEIWGRGVFDPGALERRIQRIESWFRSQNRFEAGVE